MLMFDIHSLFFILIEGVPPWDSSEMELNEWNKFLFRGHVMWCGDVNSKRDC